ncbi:hypothetical protein [Acinetobacter courvalinii]|uniref:hypothetical protein n=1 Tax=Acinetobacter courvalinii TaxID=280147 RepID=UPI0018FF54BB|nr:hypothetical protein [Acinetobacter courvalinii]MBJ9958175.1 hypothetical protein [Acinetobacter courvalinii]
MNFDRFRFQQDVEILLGCRDISKWGSYLQKFKSFNLNQDNIDNLKIGLYEDGLDCLYKGVYSISNAIFNIHHHYYSWAVIKLYYSVFYLLKCYFSARNIGFLKNGGIYTLKLDVGEVPVRRDCTEYKGNRITGEHKTILTTFEKEFIDQDILLSNEIRGMTIYNWLMDMRELVNYRERSFIEPEIKYFPVELFGDKPLKDSLEIYFKDTVPIYCFDEQHACIAAPIKILQLVSKFFYDNTGLRLSEDRVDVIKSMLAPTGLNNLVDMQKILSPQNILSG